MRGNFNEEFSKSDRAIDIKTEPIYRDPLAAHTVIIARSRA